MTYLVQVSNSKLDAFRECPYKYFVRYHEKLPEQREDTALQFGSYIHKVFERGVKVESLSALELIANEEKANYKFSKEYEPKIKKCLENFLKFNTSLNSKTKTLEIEGEHKIQLAEDITYVGIIDRVVQANDGSILIIDYKTSKTEKTKLDLAMDNQLIGYAVIYSKEHNIPISKITCAHYYPITNNFVQVTFLPFKTNSFLTEVKNLVWKIRKKTAKDFFANENKFCNWCGYKYVCPIFENPITIQKLIKEHKEKIKNES